MSKSGIPCTDCAGKGQVVKPVEVWDNQQKRYVLIDQAIPCPSCAGRGEI